KLEEGTTVYSGDRDYRKGDAPFHITIEEDGEVVFYEKLKKDEDKEEGDPDENDEEIQDYANKKLHKMDDGLKVTNANIINEHINIDVTSDYDEDLADGADMKTIKHTAIVNGIGIGNMIGQLFYMSDEYEWETLSINIDMKTIKHIDIINVIGIGNMIGQLLYMSDEYEWETLSINIDELGKIDINRQLYVGMDDKIEDANGFYTEFALEEELARKMSW